LCLEDDNRVLISDCKPLPSRHSAPAPGTVHGRVPWPTRRSRSGPSFLEGDAARAFVVDADDRSTVLVYAKTLHMLRDPVLYGLVGLLYGALGRGGCLTSLALGADPGAAQRGRAEFDAEAEALAAVHALA
jgi:hypothetical protein